MPRFQVVSLLSVDVVCYKAATARRERIGSDEVSSSGVILLERTHLTSRQMNGRLVRKTLSYSKQLKLLRAACSWEDWMYNLTRPVKTLRVVQVAGYGQQRWQARTPAMAAGLTDHVWTVKELLMTVVLATPINTK